jgi:hypothetical protein
MQAFEKVISLNAAFDALLILGLLYSAEMVGGEAEAIVS